MGSQQQKGKQQHAGGRARQPVPTKARPGHFRIEHHLVGQHLVLSVGDWAEKLRGFGSSPSVGKTLAVFW